MKKLFLLAIVVVAAVLGYRYVRPESTYKTFAEHMLNRRFADAAAMSDGLSEDDLEKIAREGIDPRMVQKLFESKFAIESSEKQPDGSMKLNAVQTVLFNPPGVESGLRPAMFAKQRQLVTLRKVSGRWRVASFSSKVEKMDAVPKPY